MDLLEAGLRQALFRDGARMAARESFESGSKDLLFYAGVHVGPQAIARMAQLVSPQMREAQSRVVAAPPPASIPVLYVKADGTGVPVRKSEAQGRKAKNGEGDAKTREVKLGAIFTQSSLDAEGKPLRDPDSTSYVGTFQCSEDFGALLRREAFARGYERAEKTVCLGDGAPWAWEVAHINFPQATCILDFTHAAEHLSLLSESLYGADPERAKSQAKLWRDMLLEERLQDVLAHARADLCRTSQPLVRRQKSRSPTSKPTPPA